MRDTDYRKAKTLEDVLKINEKEWDKPLRDRNNLLMDLAAKSESVSEIGINQGTSFAFLMLQNPKKIVGVDITLKKWRNGAQFPAVEPLALEYMKKNPMEYIMYEGNSLDKESVHEVDMLHIDSLHRAAHLQKEIDLHSGHVKKYMVFHDTKYAHGEPEYALWRVVEKFLNKNNDWELLVNYTEGKAGHAAIQRVR